jgi:hypothetical protein
LLQFVLRPVTVTTVADFIASQMLGLDLSCAVYYQDQWVFCPAMFIIGFMACTILYTFAYLLSYKWFISAGFKPFDVEVS